MPCAYNSGTNTITVTGYSETTPCTFTDIYNADVAGSWGVITRQGTDQFSVAAHLHVGDGNTAWLWDKNICVEFTLTDHVFSLSSNATFRLGEKESGENLGINGCKLVCEDGHGSNFLYVSTGCVQLYDSYIMIGGFSSTMLGDTTVSNHLINCTIVGMRHFRIAGSTSIIKNVIVHELEDYSINTRGEISVCDGVFVYNNPYAAYIQPAFGNSTFYNLVGENISGGVYIYTRVNTANLYLINPMLSMWTMTWGTLATNTRVYRQYEFDLKVVDTSGSGIPTTSVKIWDVDDNIVTNATTNASGVLAKQTLNYGYYRLSTGNTATMQTPHEMRIYKYGRKMLSSKSSIETKTDWAMTMLTDEHITQTTEATVAAYTGITINHTTETITISENHTLDEIYDYCQYDIIAATKQLDQTMHTADGVNFISEYSFVINTGITVTAADQKLSMVSGETYTLTGTAQFTGIIATTTTTRIPIKLTNIVDGSRYWVGKESDGSEIFMGTQSGSGTVVGYYEHTADIDIDIRVRKSSVSVKYKPWVGEGTLIAETFSLRIRQIPDGIVS